MTPAGLRIPRALWAPLLLLGIYGTGATSVAFAPHGSDVAIWWPAAGLAVILLLVHPRDRWWWWALPVGVLLSSGLANLTADRGWAVSLGFGAANAAEAVIVALWLCRGVRGRPGLRTQEDLWRLLTGTVLGIAAIGLGAGLTVSLVDHGSFTTAASTVFFSHGASILVIVPLALALDPAPHGRDPRELVGQWLVLAATVAVVFGPGDLLGFSFLAMPVLVWAALRFGVRTVTWQLLALAVATTAMTAHGWGPFVAGSGRPIPASSTGPLEQGYLIACAVIALPLVVAVEQRRSVLHRMTASEELFRRSFTDSLVGMVLLRLDAGRLVIGEANQTAEQILGAPAADLEGRDWGGLLSAPADLAEVAADMVAGDSDGWRGQAGLQGDPHVRLSVSLAPLSVRDGSPRFTAQMVDVTAEHEATLRMRSEMDFTSAILDTAGCLIVVAGVDGAVVGLNRAAQAITGFHDADVVDRPLWERLVPEADRAEVQAMFAAPQGSGVPLTHEADLATRSGRKRRVQWSSAFLTDADGRRTHVVMTGIDVTNERTTSGMLTHLMEAATATAFIGCDLHGRVTVFNQGATEMLGHRPEEILGREVVGAVLDPDEVDPALFADPDRPLTQDCTATRRDGSTFTMSLTVTRVLDGAGEHVGYLGVGKDVTEQRHGEAMLVAALDKERQAVEQLQALDRAKDDFVSTVSHELRTPITSIVGYVEMLQDGEAGALTPEQHRLVDVVRRNGQRLIALAEDLLTLSSFESGTASLDRVVVDLRTVVHRTEEALRPLLADRDLDVEFAVPAGPVAVRGDAGHLERVVFNLVSNAVKFTDDGGRIRCVLGADGPDAVLLVSDTGIGIPVEEQSRLFTRFFRSSTAQQRAIQGTGLGLSIVDSVVRGHGGVIAVESGHLQGTAFTVRLPLAEPAVASAVPPRAPGLAGKHAAR